MSNRFWRVAAPLLLIVALLVIWQWYATTSGVGPSTLPPPSQVLTSGWNAADQLASNSIVTLREALLGFALALVVGFALSVAIDLSRPTRYSVFPVLIVSQTLPLIIIAPLMVLWFGFGLLPKVLLVALVTFFPITVSLVHGYQTADRTGSDALSSMGATAWQTFVHLRLPSAMPSFFSGIRIAITYAIVAAIFAEYAGATEGLGIAMQVWKNSFRTDLVLAAVAVSAVLTLVLYALTYLVQWAAIPWARPQRSVRAAPLDLANL